MRGKKKKYLGFYFGIFIFFITGCHSETVKENTQSISNVTNEVVFSADFSGNSPSNNFIPGKEENTMGNYMSRCLL